MVFQVGSELMDTDGYNISLTFASIQKIAVGFEGRPCKYSYQRPYSFT